MRVGLALALESPQQMMPLCSRLDCRAGWHPEFYYMATSMLIDAAHPEETRVVVVKENRLEEFDVETSTKAQLKGNIYLAKVMRVEPSLQAAFVDYGGNRHGFLAFSEIHPDYYQIPVADRQALIDAEVAAAKEEAAREEEAAKLENEKSADAAGDDAANAEPAPEELGGEAADEVNGGDDVQSDADETAEDSDDEATNKAAKSSNIDAVGGDALEEVRPRRAPMMRNYKIQEVIKRRQIILIQVVKEERGTKGAALTTYLSLAGRYCVLMPNTVRGGGISRKIANMKDRRRLKTIVSDLDVEDGMALIVRTAGAERSKAEIRRDFDYLFKLWQEIRDKTLNSRAPALIHEEANLIRRSIRDIYNKDIDEVLVEGEEGYKTAKAFMRMLMPSHAKRVQPYRDKVPLLHKYKIDAQLDSMMSPEVGLKSGGYLVIGITEALVAIDVNSGRSTRERNIEETALKTNLEAAEEVARQLRLRDLAGLVVIDFIDMDYPRNNRAVERRLKDSLKSDRARIQVGRISHFGLMEMARQRMRPSLIEASTELCVTCGGTGLVRATSSSALHVLRALEETGLKNENKAIEVFMSSSVAIYLLNQKRNEILALEERHGMTIILSADDSLIAPEIRIVAVDGGAVISAPSTATDRAPATPAPATPVDAGAADDGDGKSEEERPARKGRRRGRRGGRKRRGASRDAEAGNDAQNADAASPADGTSEPTALSENATDKSGESGTAQGAAEAGSEEETKTRRPRRRRPRRRKSEATAEGSNASNGDASGAANADAASAAGAESGTLANENAESSNSETPAATSAEKAAPKRRRSRRTKNPESASAAPAKPSGQEPSAVPAPKAAAAGPKKPAKSGWWHK